MEFCELVCRAEFILVVFLFIFWQRNRYRYHQRIASISSRHVFITGCDSGFGRLLAVRLHGQGVHVYAGCMFHSSVDELTERYSSRMKPVLIDVTKSESVRKARDYVREQLNGRALWAIVNNAGIAGINFPFEWTSKEDVQKTLDVNLLGVYDVTLAFLPLIKPGKEGRIVNIASIFGRIGHLLSGYTMSKHGIEGFSDGLSIELDPYNITVHTLEPGYFNTSLISTVEARETEARQRWAQLDKTTRELYGEEFLEKFIRFTSEYLDKSVSPNVHLVVDAYEHAILAKYPQNRYTVGNDMKFLYVPMSWLPFPYQFSIMRLLQHFSGIQKPIPNDAIIET